jgi:hypothetical protein
MKADRRPIWSLIGEILEDIHRIGVGLAVVGLLTDFSVSAAIIAVFHDKVIDNYPLLSLVKDILETPALLRDIMGIFLSTLPLTIAISLIAARPKEFLTPLPWGAGWALVLAAILGDLLHLGITTTEYKLDPNLGGIGFLLTLTKVFVDQYDLVPVIKSCIIGVVFGSRLRHLRIKPPAKE